MAENEKIIVVQKTASQHFRTKRIWQYDVGHALRFDGFNLPYTFEVHFAHSPNGESQKQIGQDGVCEVPPEYTQNSGFAYAWLYEVTEDTGLTKHQIEIPVEGRARPTDQEPTPAEQSVIDQTIAASNNALEKTLEAKQAAENAANSVKNAGATAETLAPGSPATVVVRDVNGVKTFEFGIPEGQQGETGATPNFTVGSVTTLPAGSPVTVTITGTAENPVLNIGIPQGAQGYKGDTGAVPHFTIGTVTTLPPDSQATVTITGTDENPILNIGIPQGVQGQKGDKGDAFTYADFTEEQKTELIQGPIKTAQDEAVLAVTEEGEKQVKAVDDEGQRVLDSIPADYSELTDDVSLLKRAIDNYNCNNVFPSGPNGTYRSVTYTWNGNTCTYNGTATVATSQNRIIDSASALPSYFPAGGTYSIQFTHTTTLQVDNIKLVVELYKNGTRQRITTYTASFALIIPADITGIKIYLQVDLNDQVDGTCTILMLNAKTNKQLTEDARTKIKVCTNNLGYYSEGVSTNPYDASAVKTAYRAFLNAEDIDLLILQENRYQLTENETTDAALYTPMFPYSYNREFIKNPIVANMSVKSRYKIISTNDGTFSTGRRYGIAEIDFNGLSVFVIIVHLDPDWSKRQTEISALLALINQYKYCIAAGDFNCGINRTGVENAEQSEINTFINAGLHCANGSYIGLLPTDAAQIRAIDNIVTTPNIYLGNIKVLTNYTSLTSDHLPMTATALIGNVT